MKRIYLYILLIMILCSVITFFVFRNPPTEIESSIVKCIDRECDLYVSLGCPHCEEQEEVFGDKIDLINYTDCFYEGEKCGENNILRVPTWLCGNNTYEGVYTIEELKNITNCGILTEEKVDCLINQTEKIAVYGGGGDITNSNRCERCGDQLEEFGEYLNKFPVVECFTQPSNCTDILGVPYFQFKNGQNHSGFLSIEEMVEITGC